MCVYLYELYIYYFYPLTTVDTVQGPGMTNLDIVSKLGEMNPNLSIKDILH